LFAKLPLLVSSSDSLPLRNRRNPFVTTPARHRMTTLAITALVVGFVTTGMEIILPLWVTGELGFTPGQWAQLRSLRMWGVVGGVVFLGAFSDRFGQKVVGAVCLVCVAVLMALLGYGKNQSIWLLMPILGALMSTAFVNLNTLTQQVSDNRPGLANTIYRSIGAGTAIIAPVVVTTLALFWHGYTNVFFLIAVLSLVAAGAILFYPEENTTSGWDGLRVEAGRLHQGYVAALRQSELMRFLHVVSLWYAVFAGVGAFTAIRFTKQLGQSDQQFGILTSAGAILTLFLTIGAGFILDRVSLRRLHIAICSVASGFVVLMGLSDSLLLSGIGYILSTSIFTTVVGASSMWVSRSAGPELQGAGFTVFKVMNAFYVALVMALLSFIERWVELRYIFLGVGICGLLLTLGFMFLNEPQRQAALQTEPVVAPEMPPLPQAKTAP